MVKKNIVAEVLGEISKRDGVLKPKTVVDEARSKDSPIHDLFDWDDSSAGEKYRLWQARELIAYVTVEHNGKEVNAYYNVQLETISQKGYYSKDQILSDKNMYKEVLRISIQEIEFWENKYKTIKELKKVLNRKELNRLKALNT